MNDYLYISPSIEITQYHIGTEPILVLQSPKQQIENRVVGGQKYRINKIASEVLFQLDGTRTYQDIINYFSEKYNEPRHDVDIKVKTLLNSIVQQYGFEIKKQASPISHEIKSIDYYNIYPTVVSIELTDRCNIRCKHCYGSFGIENVNSIPKDKLVHIFKSMKEVGVLTVELTGGDPSVYPYTAEAIETAFDVGIQSVMLLTNGISLNKELIETVARHKDKMFVQIDLHSLNDKYYDWFTGSKGNLTRVQKNIDILVSKGVQVRACSIITPHNYHEVTDIAEWAYKHGAVLYATSPVVEIGRATDRGVNSDLVFTNPEELEEYLKLYDKISERYPSFIKGKVSEERQKTKNCGALTSQCSVKSNGDIKLCAMDTGEYFDLNLGNILEDSMKQIYDKNYNFLSELIELQLPRKENPSCNNCNYALFCDGCLLRGFLRAQDMEENCNWYNKYVPSIVKERFRMKESKNLIV